MNHKNKKLLLLLAVFVIPFVLSACGKIENKKPDGISSKAPMQNNEADMVKENGEMKEELVPSDKMDFVDPGNDEIGNEIKEMDDLLNQTTPSEYSEDDLSVDAIEGSVELK